MKMNKTMLLGEDITRNSILQTIILAFLRHFESPLKALRTQYNKSANELKQGVKVV